MASDEMDHLKDQMTDRYRNYLKERTNEQLIEVVKYHLDFQLMLIEEIMDCDPTGIRNDEFRDEVREHG